LAASTTAGILEVSGEFTSHPAKVVMLRPCDDLCTHPLTLRDRERERERERERQRQRDRETERQRKKERTRKSEKHTNKHNSLDTHT
jgi:ABC-type Zn2+ transport system substrate-binding protein/surface adhesin